MTLRKLISASAILLAVGGAGLTTFGVGVAQASPAVHTQLPCVAVGVETYSDGSVWAVEDCGGLIIRTQVG
ncbi:hypothetical protein [Nocardia arizonensis]|uniref:hypothetical protein n=1 Tax=Nocardia arizonensis TaxID=1141647 RepID=UPI0006D284DF|nr:hypothetical protein [Nocardia arizonensis]